MIAFLYWIEVLNETAIEYFIFGHGIGACADSILPPYGYFEQHISQIVRSSGYCYVSWGFHNTLLAIIFEYGLIGFGLFSFLIISLYKKSRKNIRKIIITFVVFILVASPNNHIVNNDLIGTLIFFVLGILHNKSFRKHFGK